MNFSPVRPSYSGSGVVQAFTLSSLIYPSKPPAIAPAMRRIIAMMKVHTPNGIAKKNFLNLAVAHPRTDVIKARIPPSKVKPANPDLSTLKEVYSVSTS